MAFQGFKSRFEEPHLSEGFDEIKKIHFKPQFSDAEQRRLFQLFLT